MVKVCDPPLSLYTFCWPCQPDAHRNSTPVFYRITELHIFASCTRFNQKCKPPILKYPSASLLLFLVLVVWKERRVCRAASVQEPNKFHILSQRAVKTGKTSHLIRTNFLKNGCSVSPLIISFLNIVVQKCSIFPTLTCLWS